MNKASNDNRLDMNSDDAKLLFISSFLKKTDREIVAIIAAWLSNNKRNENYILHRLICDTMGSNPTTYLLDYPKNQEFFEKGDLSFCGLLTRLNLHNLLLLINQYIVESDDIEAQYKKVWDMNLQFQCKYPYEVLALMFSHNTGFPSLANNGTFYRYNLLFYWLTNKLGIWDKVETKNAILPCNDTIFENVYLKGIIKKRFKPSLRSAIKLTNIVKSSVGDKYFYRAYEKWK